MPFSFLNAAFLTGLAAAALPIVIHLFSRRRVARVRFSSIQFLEEIAHRRVRRVRLTQWIILALRVLALAFLALALGRPAFRGDFAFGKSRGESAVAIVLDGSYSMRAEGERETLWAKAKGRAEEAIAALEAEDQILLVGVDPRVEDVESYPGAAGAAEALRNREAGFGTTDLAGAVRRAAGQLANVTALNKELFVISDFQRSGFGAGTETLERDLLSTLDPRTRVFLIPVGEGPIANSAIEDARLEGSAVDQRVRVQAARHAAASAEDLAVTVEAGSEVLGETVLFLGAQGRETVDVPLTRMPGEGEELRARLARDRLPEDDMRYVPALGAGSVNVLLVQDPAQPSPFLPLALSPEGGTGRFTARRATPDDLITADLSDVRLLILDNVGTVPREALMRLRPWRAGGGALWISLGDRVDLRYYNEALLPALFPGVALGNLLGTEDGASASYTLAPRAAGHETFAGFGAEIGRPLTGAAFWRIGEVKNGEGVRTLAEFGPALPARVDGERAILFASSLDGRWNNFPTHAAFLPLLHQSLDAVLREGGEDRAVVGEPVQGVLDRASVPAGEDLVCVGPEGIELDVVAEPEPRGLLARSAPAPRPGFYTIRAADRVVLRRAVNMDTAAESDLTPLTNEEVLAMFAGARTTLIEAGEPLGTPIREARYGREFWRELVLLVLLLMIAEAWLSRRGVA
jgi:tetrahydromethanopterin S-methyltransferase subunit B